MNTLTQNQPWALTRVVGFTSATAILVVGMGAQVMAFVDAPSLIFAVGVTAALLVLSHGFNGVTRPFHTFLFGAGREDQELATAFFLQMGGVSLSVGTLGGLLGCIQMSMNLADPSAIGPAMAVTVLTILYGLGMALFAFSAALSVARAPTLERP